MEGTARSQPVWVVVAATKALLFGLARYVFVGLVVVALACRVAKTELKFTVWAPMLFASFIQFLFAMAWLIGTVGAKVYIQAGHFGGRGSDTHRAIVTASTFAEILGSSGIGTFLLVIFLFTLVAGLDKSKDAPTNDLERAH
jgi:hypothetical protein